MHLRWTTMRKFQKRNDFPTFDRAENVKFPDSTPDPLLFLEVIHEELCLHMPFVLCSKSMARSNDVC